MTRRRRLTAVAASSALVAALVSPAASADAAPVTPGASGYASAASTGTGTMAPTLQLTGTLGRLLDGLISPIINQSLTPLVGALQGTVNTTVASLLGTGGSLQAATTATLAQVTTKPAAFPNDTLPSPCVTTGSQPCYQAAGTNVAAAPLATVALGALKGYAEQVAQSADPTNPVFGRAAVASSTISVLPGLLGLVNPVIAVGAVESLSNCPNDGASGATKPATAPSSQVTTSGITAFGGVIKFGVLNGQITNLVVNGVSYASLAQLPTLTVGGITISSFGTSVLASLPLSLSQVVGSLGLDPAIVSSLLGMATSSTMQLRFVLGPTVTTTNKTSTASGLTVGVDLSGRLDFNLLGLVGAGVVLPTGIAGGNFGNLLDLRLAYTSCISGVTPSGPTGGSSKPPLVPPSLV